VEIGEHPAPAVLDGAIGLALATASPLRVHGPLSAADLAVALSAVKLGADGGAVDAAREALSSSGTHSLTLLPPRPGVHVLELPAPGAVARALWTFPWSLALLGKPSTLHLRGPNHSDGAPSFHELRLGWARLASQLGLRVSLELTQAGFGDDIGTVVASIEPVPAFTPLHAAHRGLLRQVSVVAAVGGGRHESALEAAQQVVRAMRRQGVVAEAERVPLPLSTSAQVRARFAITATAEFDKSLVTVSELGQWGGDAVAVGERVADRLGSFLRRRGALDASMAERMLLPSFFCAAGLGARAGTPPTCHYSTSEVTGALLELATLARQALPVRAVVDGAQGEEGVVVVAPGS
jgi:RNA 3'-terminal phosphate cyclase